MPVSVCVGVGVCEYVCGWVGVCLERNLLCLNPKFVGAIICHFSALDHGL